MRGCRLMSNFFLGSVVAQRLQCDYEPDPYVNPVSIASCLPTFKVSLNILD